MVESGFSTEQIHLLTDKATDKKLIPIAQILKPKLTW